jgi:hypothetical protein
MMPSFNISGVLPPFVGDNPTNGAEMSPYQTTMTKIVQRFATTPERIEILLGLIAYWKYLIDRAHQIVVKNIIFIHCI